MTAQKRKGRGGRRVGAGRPAGLPELVRRNRVTFLLTDAELERLRELARKRALPPGTLAYELVRRALKP